MQRTKLLATHIYIPTHLHVFCFWLCLGIHTPINVCFTSNKTREETIKSLNLLPVTYAVNRHTYTLIIYRCVCRKAWYLIYACSCGSQNAEKNILAI